MEIYAVTEHELEKPFAYYLNFSDAFAACRSNDFVIPITVKESRWE